MMVRHLEECHYIQGLKGKRGKMVLLQPHKRNHHRAGGFYQVLMPQQSTLTVITMVRDKKEAKEVNIQTFPSSFLLNSTWYLSLAKPIRKPQSV